MTLDFDASTIIGIDVSPEEDRRREIRECQK